MNAATHTRCIKVCAGGGCLAGGALDVAARFAKLLGETAPGADGAVPPVELKSTGCQGPCAKGPLVTLVNTDAADTTTETVYGPVGLHDVEEIVSEHVQAGRVVGRLQVDTTARGQVRLVLRNCGRIDPERIDDYLGAAGYQGLKRAILTLEPAQVVEELKQSGLRGRGGAGFPTWRKWDLARLAPGTQKFVLCNADEGDPGAFMDRSVLEGDPHSVIEGMGIAAYAVGAQHGYVYVRAEYPLAVERLATAIAQARERGYLGENICGSAFSFDLDIRMGSGAFVCGEETALIASIEGLRGEPRPRPPFPASRGLWDCPTVLNNVETYANVPVVLHEGPQALAKLGTESSKGTKVFALAGAVRNTGLVEVPIGTSLGELIFDIGGGMVDGKTFKAAQIGGPSGGCIPKEHLAVALDYDSLRTLGAIMGSGGLIVMDEDTCMVDVARFFLEFVQEESCGKCAPCRVGTKRMLEIIERICAGDGRMADLDTLEELGHHIQSTALCGLGQTAPNPVLSTLRFFRHEYEEHIRNKRCAAGVCPALVRAPCQSACPAGVDIPGFVALVGQQRYAEALRLHRERNPFAAVCARVCFHTCEDHCRRSTIDNGVAIRGIKRFMVDQEIVIQHPKVVENAVNARRKVAIVGGGPAGLSCAYFLCRLGYRPTVFEAQPRPGGMLVQTIPAYRLPRETLAREIRMIEQMGTTIHTETALGRDFSLESLAEAGYGAAFVAIGAGGEVDLGIGGERSPGERSPGERSPGERSPGERSPASGAYTPGVVQAIPFLREYNIRGSVPVGESVVVIGGGNAAIDTARTAVRLGAKSVTVVYRRSQDQMPAYAEEVEEALKEGVVLRCLMQPLRIVTTDTPTQAATGSAATVDKGSAAADSRVRAVVCAPTTLGEFDRSGRRRATRLEADEISLPADQVIVAVGQALDGSAGLDAAYCGDHGFLTIDPVNHAVLAGSAPGRQSELVVAGMPVFAGGDVSTGPASVVEAIAAGERAAVAIDQALNGTAGRTAFWRQDRPVPVAFDPDKEPAPYRREPLQTVAVERRRHSFEEVELAWDEVTARNQCDRCLRCDFGKSHSELVEELGATAVAGNTTRAAVEVAHA